MQPWRLGPRAKSQKSLEVQNVTDQPIKIKVDDYTPDLKQLLDVELPKTTGSVENYETDGWITLQPKKQWRIPTEKTKRRVYWKIGNKEYKTIEAYNPLECFFLKNFLCYKILIKILR